MVIYEVNLFVDKAVTSEYLHWLKPHIEEMLRLPGFQAAKLFQVDQEQNRRTLWTIHYQVESEQLLEEYFKSHADQMRKKASDLVAGKFTAERRILRPVDPGLL